MKNHLFIGLGGQGGRSLAELRKVIEHREKDVLELQQKQGVKWNFLSIDSSSDVWDATKDWKNFGKDVSLLSNQKLPLARLNQAGGLSIRPDVAPWIGDQNVIDSYLGGMGAIPGANQRRRFGRLLFANNADQVRQAIRSQVAGLTQAASNQCWFHIFASLAGGTGSGSIVDIVTLIRSQYPNSDPKEGFPIFLHLYVTHDDGAANVGYFYQNQYATLRDINALLCGKLKPNLLGAQEAGTAFSGTDPVNGIALFSSLNDRNVNLPLETQIRIAAESCFERIFAMATGQLKPNTQKALTNEDLVTTFPGEPTKNIERSYRFGSLGMRRWEVPSAKLEEFVALDLVASAISQMLYNHWQEGQGFTDVLTVPAEGKSAALCDGLLKQLAERLLSSSRETLNDQLEQGIGELLQGFLRLPADERNLEALEAQFRTYYSTNFLSGGATQYLQGVATRRNGLVAELIVQIDDFLTRAWKDSASPIGLTQISTVIESFSAVLRERITASSGFDEQLKTLNAKRSARKAEWLKLTPLSRLFGKDSALVTKHVENLQNEYAAKFISSCHEQDIELQRAVLAKINELSLHYRVAVELLNEFKAEAEKERDEIFSELQRMQNSDGANLYVFELPALDKFRNHLRQHQGHQEHSSLDLRGKVVPEGFRLSRFHFANTNGTLSQIREVIDNDFHQAAAGQVRSVHQQSVAAGVIAPVLNASLLDRLQSHFSRNPGLLATEAKAFIDQAASSLHLDMGQIQPAVLIGGGVGVSQMPKRVMVLGIPSHPFSGQIKTAFEQAISAKDLHYVTDIYEHNDVTQLRLLVMDYWMAARFSTTVVALAASYRVTATQNAQNNLLYFCNIDTSGQKGLRPDLLLPPSGIMKLRLEAALWLGQKLSPQSIIVDQNGVFLQEGSNPERVGSTVDDVMSVAAIPLMYRVDTLLKDSIGRLSEGEKAAVLSELKAEDQRRRHSGVLTSPEFQKWIALYEQISVFLEPQ
jgi:hypothetical protein